MLFMLTATCLQGCKDEVNIDCPGGPCCMAASVIRVGRDTSVLSIVLPLRLVAHCLSEHLLNTGCIAQMVLDIDVSVFALMELLISRRIFIIRQGAWFQDQVHRVPGTQ